jgi:hypothetical protein
MRLAYSPSENKGAETVQSVLFTIPSSMSSPTYPPTRHLCHSDAYFIAPSTFPGVKSPQEYAESHSNVMASVSDLHIDSYDQIFAKDGHVCLRYSASGSHCGESHNGIEASGNKASWHAAAIFEVEGGKIKGWTKEWDKLDMWKQLGWMRGDEYV